MALWKIEKEFRFEAAHQLPSHDGKCQRLHGHSWKGRLICQGSELQKNGPKKGMLIDFSQLKDAVQPLLDSYLDHHHLNVTLGLEDPTSEEVARWIYRKLKPTIPLLSAVVIEETCTSRCEYSE